jgi:hypothetical protein
LDTQSFLEKCEETSHCLFDMLITYPKMAEVVRPFVNVELSDPADIDICKVIELTYNYDIFYKTMNTHCRDPFFDKLYKFIVKIEKSDINSKLAANAVDIHNGNFGYNSKGEIRMLDI